MCTYAALCAAHAVPPLLLRGHTVTHDSSVPACEARSITVPALAVDGPLPASIYSLHCRLFVLRSEEAYQGETGNLHGIKRLLAH